TRSEQGGPAPGLDWTRGRTEYAHLARDVTESGRTSRGVLDVSVHGSRVTSAQRDIEPRTGRGLCFVVEWPKDVGGSHREAGTAFKWRIPAPISSQTRSTIPARGTVVGRQAMKLGRCGV